MRRTEPLTRLQDAAWKVNGDVVSQDAIDTILDTVRALIREDSPDGEQAREALGLRVERWHGTYPDQRLISEWESKAGGGSDE